MYFKPVEECAKCDQVAVNKNAVDFTTLSIFFSLHRFKIFFSSF